LSRDDGKHALIQWNILQLCTAVKKKILARQSSHQNSKSHKALNAEKQGNSKWLKSMILHIVMDHLSKFANIHIHTEPSGLTRETPCCKVGAAALSFVSPDLIGIIHFTKLAILEGLSSVRREDKHGLIFDDGRSILGW
jgi:hypothetical protein